MQYPAYAKTIGHLKSLATLPEGAQAVNEEPPAEVAEELNSAAFSIGTFFQLIPLFLQILQNEQIRELIRQLFAVLKPETIQANPALALIHAVLEETCE